MLDFILKGVTMGKAFLVFIKSKNERIFLKAMKITFWVLFKVYYFFLEMFLQPASSKFFSYKRYYIFKHFLLKLLIQKFVHYQVLKEAVI